MTVYPAKLSDLRSSVEAMLLTSSTAQDDWSSDRLNKLLNMAYRTVRNEIELSFEDHFFTHVEDVTPTLGTDGKYYIDTYNGLSKMFKRAVKLARVNGDSVRQLEIIPAARAIGDLRFSTSEYWYLVESALKTDFNIAGAAGYRLLYNYATPDMENDEDVCEIPPDYQQMVEWLAASMAAEMAGDDGLRAMYDKRYQESKLLMQQNARSIVRGLRQSIKSVEDYDTGRGNNSDYYSFHTWTANG